MEEQDEGELEFREEELVDFEGSDYSIEYDDEFGYEEEMGGPLSSTISEDILLEQTEHCEQPRRKNAFLTGDHINSTVGHTIEGLEFEVGDAQPNHLDHTQDAAESGDIEEGKYEKDDFTVSRISSSFDTNILDYKGSQVGAKKHLRADLEDGELDDAAMPEAFNYEALGNMDVSRASEECIGKERKKRNFEDASECQTVVKGKESKETWLTIRTARQNRPRGRQSDYSANFAKGKPAGCRGPDMHMFGLAHANLAPCLMGPTRPLMPRGLGGPLHHFGGPLGMSASIQFQDALLQEQIMMSNHPIQLGMHGPRHPPFNMNVPPPHLFADVDYFGHGPRGMMHIQPRGPNMVPPVNCVGALDNTGRGQMSMYGAGRSLLRGSCSNIGGRGGSFPRNGFGRPATWPSSPIDIQAIGRGRGQGHQVELDEVKNTQVGQFRLELMVGVGQKIPVDVNKADKIVQGKRMKWIPMKTKNSTSGENTSDARQLSDGQKTSVEDCRNSVVSSMPQATNKSQEPGPSTANMIQLGGPVQRSRVLTVGGLPEGTPLSIVIEAFEKQGKIEDVKKRESGDAFTITFSTLHEAVSAKRLLHRSILRGKQITVDYFL